MLIVLDPPTHTSHWLNWNILRNNIIDPLGTHALRPFPSLQLSTTDKPRRRNSLSQKCWRHPSEKHTFLNAMTTLECSRRLSEKRTCEINFPKSPPRLNAKATFDRNAHGASTRDEFQKSALH